MRAASLIALVSRIVAGIGLLTLAGALPWLSRRDPATSILRARYAELEPTPEALEQIRQELRLDGGPIAISARWWAGVVRGDLGDSWVSGRPVGPGALNALGVSMTLTTCALIVTAIVLVTIILPVCLRVLRDKPARGAGPVGVGLTAMPEFLLASALLVVVAVQLQWLPPYGWTGWQSTILPSMALGIPAGGMLGRLLWDAVGGAASERWVEVARMAGAPGHVIVAGVLRRAAAAVVDQLALVIIGILGGAVAVEQVFAIPGLGRYMLGAANAQDLPALQAAVLAITVVAALAGASAGLARLLLWGGPLPQGAISAPPESHRNDRASTWTLGVAAGALALILAAGLPRNAEHIVASKLAPPSLALPFGADAAGRDLLARVAHGAIGTLAPALVIVLFSIAVGLIIAFAGPFAAGPIDVANATPPIISGVIVAALVGPTQGGAVVAVLWVSWPPLAAHASALLDEARAMPHVRWLPLAGFGTVWITLRYVVPSVLPMLLRHGMLRLPGVALALAALGFLGLGAQPPTPEWGLLLSEGIGYVERAPWATAGPAFVLVLVSVIAVAASGVRPGRGQRTKERALTPPGEPKAPAMNV